MKKTKGAIILSIFTGLLFISCGGNTTQPNPEFVAAISSGVLRRNETVKVQFLHAQNTAAALSSNAFVLRPSVNGTVSWLDDFTLAFTPSQNLRAGQRYQARVNLEGIPSFGFDFTVAIPEFNVQLDPLQVSGQNDVLISGIVTVDDDFDNAAIEQTISSREIGRPSWTHENGIHRFFFNHIAMEEAPRDIQIAWIGAAVGSPERGFSTVMIPGRNVLQMVSLRRNDGIIEVSFSAPLNSAVDMRGFISLSGNTNVRHSVEGNMIRIFAEGSGGFPAGTELLIQDITDINGNALNVPVVYVVPDRWELPEVRFAGTGVVLPTSQGARLIVETRNVSGMLVEAFQIYEHNMLQFLQVNSLSGSRELERVGEPVWTHAFDFEWNAADQNRWIRRGLDMSELSRMFPGGMFHMRISFRPRHVQFVCTAAHGDFSNLEFPDDSFPVIGGGGPPNFWTNVWRVRNDNWREWNNHRHDPCHPSFFTSWHDRNITRSRNIHVSDLGLFAKRSLDGSFLIGATNLITARPSPNTSFRIYNFQGRQLFNGRTGGDGTAVIPAERAAEMGSGSRLVLFAENNLGRAFLRINDGNVLSVSHFDIAGGSPAAGLRGLIYGERDVWRPGDNVYLTFLLADPMNTLPAGHPVLFELEDPRGRPVLSRSITDSVDGFYSLHFSTPPNAPTGNWTARVRVGGSTFSRAVRIETIMPNRLRMDIDFGGEEIIKSGPRDVNVSSSWLHGAPASGLRADISVSFADMETSFPAFPDFVFRDPSRTVNPQRQNLWEGTLNREGNASFRMSLNPGTSVPGRVVARFMSRVFEPSGVFSSEQINVVYSPFERYVGLRLPAGDVRRGMLFTDTDHSAEIVLLDEEGNLVSDDVQIEFSLYRMSWRWWWERGGDEAAEFATLLARNPQMRGTVTAQNGRAEWNFRVNSPDWGRYLILARDTSGGHAAAQVVFIDWPHWRARAQEGGQDATTTLVLTTSQPVFNVGERVRISFPSNRDASAHVVIEKSGTVLRNEWIICEGDTTYFEFVADSSMVPNLYAHVTLFQPHLQTQNDLPIRMHGIVPIIIEDINTILHPRITAPDNWQAESAVSFTVSEESGWPIVYTVAVVDEGLLGLTRFRLPNPRNTFYAREASFIRTWDMYQDVIGAFSGMLETLLAIGGGEDIQIDGGRQVERFRPIVRFFGPYKLGAGEERTKTFDLPPYTGALRIMVMAASSTVNPVTTSQRAFGTAERSVTVTSDLMVFATLPRVLSPNDEVVIPVYVNSLAAGRRNVRVSLDVPGAEVMGQAVQNVSFEESGEQLIRFKVKAPENPRDLQFTVRAESAGLRTAQHVVDLEVRSTAMPVTRSVFNLIQPGQSWTGNIEYPGRDGSNTLAAAFSRLPPINLDSRLGWLISYPHGCLEQITSAAFPQVHLDRIIELSDQRRAEVRSNVNAGISRVLAMQLMSGGFSYWPGQESAHDWASSYVGHFLLEARRAGYYVPNNAIRSWVHFQRNAAALWQAGSGRFLEQAYRLYTLALAGEADIGSMNRLRAQPNLPVQASWRLAAAYWLAGQREPARNMISALYIPRDTPRQLSGNFGSTFRDKAMILDTLITTNASHDQIFPLFTELSNILASDQWLSTQETAFALVAMAPFIQASTAGGEMVIDYNLAGSSGSISFSSPSAERDFGNVLGTSSAFNFTNRSSVPVYVILSSRGLPEEGSEPALSEGLSLTVEYRNDAGRIIDPSELQLSEDMEVIVRVRNTFVRVLEEVALVVPVPASWEIINTRIGGAPTPRQFSYQDIRDDRVLTYFNLNRGEEITVRFRVNKSYEGNFFRPAIHVYAMYDETIRAVIPGVRH